MFFGGGFHNQNVYTRRGGRWQRAENHTQNREVSLLNTGTSYIDMAFYVERQISCLSFECNCQSPKFGCS
jgi:hypothetical protein